MESRNRHIILAEDEPASRVLLKRQLQRENFQVEACANGQEALEAICRAGAGIVIADWMMPELDGIELCRVIREHETMGSLGMVYFLLLTAYSAKEQIVAGLDAGADDYLTKPYHPKELFARINAGLRILNLHEQAVKSQMELHKVNARLAVLNQKLERQANTDALTGLANRRFLYDRLAETWALSERKSRPLACVLLDIDHFKQVNDMHGHKNGDLVLQNVAQVVQQTVRAYDFCVRFGGEEFLVICPDTTVEGAAALAERIRANVAQLTMTSGAARLSVTVSIGVAARRSAHECEEAMIHEADVALYRAKSAGRNQIWVSDTNGVPGPLLGCAPATASEPGP